MTKIAIFGDSFAARMHQQIFQHNRNIIKQIYKTINRKFDANEIPILSKNWRERCTSWMDYLNADVYGQIGSDIYYSYNQFIKNQKNYEKCIFLITGRYRYSSNISDKWMHCVDISEAIRGTKDNNLEVRTYYNHLLDFFKNIYFKDLDRIATINQAMIDSILSIRPDTILIEVYPHLESVYQSELRAWNITHEEINNLKTYIDLRECHMTNDNNHIFATYILDNLDTTGYLDLNPIQWKMPSAKEKDFYIVKFENIIGELL